MRAQFTNGLPALIPLGLLAWIVVNAIAHPELFATLTMLGASRGIVYALVGMGFAIIYEIGKLLNFAHGDTFMLGAVGSTWFLVEVMGADSPSARNWYLLILTLILAALFGATLGATTEKLVFEKLRGIHLLTPLIASIGLSFILQNIGLKWNGSGKKKFGTVLTDAPPYVDFDSVLHRTPIILAMAIPFMALAILFMKFSKYGIAIRAASEDSGAATLMGVNVNKTVIVAFAVAGALAGVGGVIYAQDVGVVNYNLGMTIGLVALASAIIGGVGTLTGSIIGGISVGLIEALSIGLPAGLGGRWSHTAIFGVLIVVLVYRPDGIFKSKATN